MLFVRIVSIPFKCFTLYYDFHLMFFFIFLNETQNKGRKKKEKKQTKKIKKIKSRIKFSICPSVVRPYLSIYLSIDRNTVLKLSRNILFLICIKIMQCFSHNPFF